MATKDKITITRLLRKIHNSERISMLALYDYPSAVFAQQAGVDSILVGDSVAMAIYGFEDTLQATMDMMIAHTRAVRRGAADVYLIGDMPYMSYQPSTEEAIKNAGRFLAEGKADAVKLEGGENVLDTVKALTKASIPVVGHLGLLPQSAAAQGGFRVQAREAHSAMDIINQAVALQNAGISMLILECVPPLVAEEIVKRMKVPVIGIGSGPACHGQVQLLHDILGLYPRFKPKFVKRFAELENPIVEAIKAYADEISSGKYPDIEHSYPMKQEEKDELLRLLNST